MNSTNIFKKELSVVNTKGFNTSKDEVKHDTHLMSLEKHDQHDQGHMLSTHHGLFDGVSNTESEEHDRCGGFQNRSWSTVTKIMQIGIKGYSSRHRKMYKAKVGNYCLYRFNKENFKGLEIVVKGRLRGALRAGKEVLTDGTVSKNSLKTRLEYNELEVRSKTGILNVKVSLAKRI